MKKILITGGSGFIGSNLREQLEGKYDVHAPTSSELDLLDKEDVWKYLKNAGFDTVIHCAWWNKEGKGKSGNFKNNLSMFLNVARCNDYFGKMIFYGSQSEFDKNNYEPEMLEEFFDINIPTDNLGLTKYFMTKYAQKVDNIYNLRLFCVFGKYDDHETKFISNTCYRAVRNMPINISQNVFLDYIHVDDVVNITEWFIENKPKDKIYNVCTGRTTDLVMLARKIVSASKKDLKITVSDEDLGREVSGSNSKLLKEIGNYNFRSTNESIKELYNWYLEEEDAFNEDSLSAA